MPTVLHNPPGVFPPYRAYSHAAEVRGEPRWLFVSGLNGFEADGIAMPESFDAQAERVWQHLKTILRAADMDVRHLVSLRTYLAHPGYDAANGAARLRHLQGHCPASTVVCCQLLEPRWKLELEAVAAA